MNTGNHIVRNKQVYAISRLDPSLKTYLELRTGCSLTKLRLIPLENAGFYRWKLEGIRDSANGFYKYGSLFEEMVPELEYLLGDSLKEVVKFVMDRGTLGIDVRDEEDIFQRVLQEKVDYVMSDEFLDWREERYPRGKKPNLVKLYWFK